MKFKIFLIYHSHIDIGYTERQEKIAAYQGDFIKQAVDYVLSANQNQRNSKNKFKFTAEGFWAVEQYLEKYKKAGEEKLLKAINTENFELTAGYLNMAELLNYKNLQDSLSYCNNFCRQNNIASPKVAMSADINGFSWGFADALIESGVEYLITNINTHHGGAPFSKPLVPFYWEGPSGKKLLVWNGLAYHKANLLGLIPGLTPVRDPGIPGMIIEETGFIDIKDTEYAQKRIFNMVKMFKENGYAYDFLPIMGSGLYTDNSPVGEDHCELIKEWNEKFGNEIEIVTGTLVEFFEYLKENVKELPTFAGDWNDWWTDGVISTPNETKIFRNAQRTESLIEKLDPEYKIIPKSEREKIIKQLILYSEHTWGHSASYSDPCKLLVGQLDARKAKIAYDADVLAGMNLDKLTRALGEGEFKQRRPFEYLIINPLDVKMKKEIFIPTDFWEEGLFTSGEYCVYDGDKKLACQRTYRLRGAFLVCVVELLPKEQKTLKIVFGEKSNENITEYKYFEVEKDENGLKTLSFNGEKVFDSVNGDLCTPVYQIFRNGNRKDAAGFGYSSRTKPANEIIVGEKTGAKICEDGNVFTKIVYDFDIEGSKNTHINVYIYKEIPVICVEADFAKELVLDPEGMYVKFPLRLNNGEWYLDKAGAFFKPGCQLPDTCCDYYPVNRGVALVGDKNVITVNCFDTPLVTFNKIKLWDFTLKAENKGDLYSWITNNKWETNFRAACAGFIESRYRIAFGNNALEQLEENEYEFLVLRG